MDTRARIAALVLSLVSATPAMAKAPVQSEGGESDRLGLTYVPRVEVAATANGLFGGTRPGLSVSHRLTTEEDGSSDVDRRVVAVTPVAENARIGVGLFSITRDSVRERAIGRINPMRDVGGRSRTIAAVGFSLSF